MFDVGEIRTLEVSTGEVVDRYPMDEDRYPTSPAIWDDQTLFVGNLYAEIVALRKRASAGWVIKVSGGVLYSPPALHRGILVTQVCSPAGARLVAALAESGQVLWEWEGSSSGRGVISLAEGYVIHRRSGANSVQLALLDLEDGREVWLRSASSPSDEDSVEAGCAVARGIVFACLRADLLEARNLVTGDLLWCQELGGACSAAPVACRNLVFVGSENGAVEAFDTRCGERAWRVDLPGTILSTPAVGSSGLVVATRDGVWCLGMKAVT